MRPLLLDTCAALWLANHSPLSESAMKAIRTAAQIKGGLLVSPVTAWEVGLLVSRGRLALSAEPSLWFDALLDIGIGLARTTPEVLIASSFLPASSLRDPADRIVAATARTGGFSLVTRDRPLLDYAAAGHLHAIAC